MPPLIAYNAALLREPYSGVELTIDATARALAAHGTLDYRIYAPAAGIRPLPEHARCTLAPDVPAFRSRRARIWWEQTRLPRLLRRDGATLLHAPAYVAPVAAPCPVVLTVHDLHVLTHPRFCTAMNRLHYRLLLPFALRRAAAIVVYSEHVRRIVIARFPRTAGRISVIPPGVPVPCDRLPDSATFEAVRRRHDLPPRYLLFVGNLTPRKNLTGLLSALSLLRASHGERLPTLVLAGAAAEQGIPVAALAERLGVRERVRLIGYAPPNDLPALYAMAEALVFPSHDEGFGLPVLEAMACGCPAICTPGGSAETGGEAVLLCDPADPASIAAAVRSLLENPEQRAACIAAGRRRAAQFRWERTVRRLEELYRSVSREAAKDLT